MGDTYVGDCKWCEEETDLINGVCSNCVFILDKLKARLGDANTIRDIIRKLPLMELMPSEVVILVHAISTHIKEVMEGTDE